MYVRRTQTRARLNAEGYYTFRLVRSDRISGKVAQRTLLNLGRHFALPSADWPAFCARIEQLLSPQSALLAVAVDTIVEAQAQRYAAQLKPISPAQQSIPTAKSDPPSAPELVQPATAPSTPEFTLVDVDSLAFSDTRSVGVEAVALRAIDQLGLREAFRNAGLNGVSLNAALGQIVARMAAPASERATHKWLQTTSALGELLSYDFAAMPLQRLYRAADPLWNHHVRIEAALHLRLREEFGLTDTVALYDLTNTYFEGIAASNSDAQRGRSKEKRSDAPLVTLGLVLDGAGFVRRSDVFAGNISEAKTLQGMLKALFATPGALVVLDRGIAKADNLTWLRENGFRYLVMTQERHTFSQPTALSNDSGITWERRIDPTDGDVRLICHSQAREAKESAMNDLQQQRLEAELVKIKTRVDSRIRTDVKPSAEQWRRSTTLNQRIGRLKNRYSSIAQHYAISFTTDPLSSDHVDTIHWTYQAKSESRADLPGYYVMRSNDLDMAGETLWRTYMQLTEVEAVFRSLKSELGLRPIYHQKASRTKAHLWISVLAYQCVQWVRTKLKAAGISQSWQSLRKDLNHHRRVTASFDTANGDRLHVRKPAQASAEVQAIYRAIGVDATRLGGIRKRRFTPADL